jgi:hypothetical protein
MRGVANAGPLNIPQEHLPLVINSLICERLMDFKRELVNDEAGTRHVWSGQNLDGEQTDQLFNFMDTDALAIELLNKFVDANELGYNLIRVPKTVGGHPVQALLLGADSEGRPTQRAHVSGNKIGPVICLLILGYMQVDIQAQHRALFPGHYLLLQS